MKCPNCHAELPLGEILPDCPKCGHDLFFAKNPHDASLKSRLLADLITVCKVLLWIVICLAGAAGALLAIFYAGCAVCSSGIGH